MPDPQRPQTFQDSKLDWSEVDRVPHARLLAWYRDLIRLRQERPDLHDGRLGRVEVSHDRERGMFWMRRGEIQVLANLSDEPRSFEVDGAVLLAWDNVVSVSGGAVELPPHSAAILEP